MSIPTLNNAPITKNVILKNRTLNLREWFEDHGNEPLPIRFDKAGGTWHPIDDYKKYFPRLIGSKMTKIQNTQSQASFEAGSSPSTSISDAHITDENLDIHCGFRRGVRGKLTRSAPSTRSIPLEFPALVLEDIQRYMHESQ
ncbi:hypothetical protein PanWU01x14_210120 [Parasponia andersonii]|uniref:Uncharacterized protein n=1 Tax=Parasponia andersonii TaxID=3476 RepID=A0A2P5BU25_PARAD|nr:hypothetical protein PanWU01x14_210120 [Parasponia andersonii]